MSPARANGGHGKYKTKQEMKDAISNGVACEICGLPAEVADHCHKTRKWRAPLCVMCNSGLGFFGDNPVMLRSAADYLERYLTFLSTDDESDSREDKTLKEIGVPPF